MAIILESPESSSPIVTRTVANGLLGRPSINYRFSIIEQTGLRFLGHLPKEAAEWLVPKFYKSKALSATKAANLKTSDLVNGRLNDYRNNEGKFPAITIGAGMGGTTAHLALALGGPFLPQAFVLTFKNGTMNGNVNDYFNLGDGTAKTITNQNPELMTIQHYDPVHDGWIVKRANHIRIKLIDLPDEYKEFIRKKIITGGDIVYLEGNAKWKRFRTGQRNVLQVGGWGDIGAEEFLYGSQRLTKFAQKEKLEFSKWVLDGYPLEDGPESEWGSESGLGEALQAFCKEEGFHFNKISYENPNNFTQLVFRVKKEMLKKEKIEPQGVVIEMFSQFDTSIVDQSALIPLWLIFNTNDSKIFLLTMLNEFPKGKPVFFSGLATFSHTPDLVPWDEWEKSLNGFEIINIGSRKSHYPSDTLALLDWKKPLYKWSFNNLIKNIKSLPVNDLMDIYRKTLFE